MNFNVSQAFKQHLPNAKQLATNRLLRPNFFANVVGVGIGRKIVDNQPTETECIRIYVQSKLDLDDITPAYLLPSSFLDIPTDIIRVDSLGETRPAGNIIKPTRPIGPGSPIRLDSDAPNVNTRAIGTLGAVVVDTQGQRYILSCNHILAVNGRVKTKPTRIVFADAAHEPEHIATPGPFVSLDRKRANLVDCALAPIDKGAKVMSTFREGIGEVSSAAMTEPYVGQKVSKVGAITGKTFGKIVDVHADLYVDYSFGTFLFTNQIVIDGDIEENDTRTFASDGDSGSIVVDENNQAVGMIFAESGRFAVASPFTEVLDQLGVALAPGEQVPAGYPARVPVEPKNPPAFVIDNVHAAKDLAKVSRS